ncbi:copper chaperone PCu(A)C [Microbulbifer spongiae]|uniref:Copper chaperone PCu(A)C n=1 Tax=Microbulbifer spongiae TaxID=2944933 RepID=A0ABY9E9R1_9GAMM|nr:copper chaperone PCu(A)C [Microbulbifer sp. MI-G]WKD49422.1 copper chaperone PCu(A)C [Microbulbifer sp. MI-G]
MKNPLIAVWIIFGTALLCATQARSTTPVLTVAGYARETLPGAPMSAAYLSLHNTGMQAMLLTEVTLPEVEGASADLHSTEHRGGVSRMRRLQHLAIEAGEQLEMAPGGVHLMLNGLRLQAGETLLLRLLFADASHLDIRVPVIRMDGVNKAQHQHHE